jgi:glycosyltransferase involved in cell wall biosynthesis
VYRVPSLRRDLRLCRAFEAATYVLSALPKVAQLCRRQKYDLVHSQFILPDGLLGSWARFTSGAPFILTAHGTDVPHHNPQRVRRLHSVLLPAWRRLTSQASLVVCPSRYLQMRVLQSNASARTAVIPIGFDPNRFRPQPKSKRILVVTRMVEFKGIQFLLQALEGLQIDHEVTLVGEGPYRATLERYASEHSIPVRFTGWLDNDSRELKELYETSSIFVFPSESENCPFVLLEAMAAGLAIVTSADTGSAELVGDVGVLVPPRDPQAIRSALIELTNSPESVSKLGSAARARLENTYSWAAIAGRYLEIYLHHARKP